MRPSTIAEIVAESRAAQGLPPKITDPVTLQRIAKVVVATYDGGEHDAAA